MSGEGQDEYLSVTQARMRLGVSRQKMTDLVASGVLLTQENPLDKREKLIALADIEALERRVPKKGAA